MRALRFLLLGLLLGGGFAPAAGAQAGAYPRIEASFEIADLTGDPFDYRANDVRVTIQGPNGSPVIVPAFFDGGALWRVRYTPRAPGAYRISAVTRNGGPAGEADLQPREWVVAGAPEAGFVRIDRKNPQRFAFDDGRRYFPVGHNVAWGEIPVIFPKMAAAGENWSRVWMAHWAGNNLDWAPGAKNEPGKLYLHVARKWDTIVETAERTGIYFQLVLQHHGQYSSSTNPNWQENPWNTANGGFLATPEEFFTSERTRALTKAKYRYIVARWGYSPAIMAWELFNEVQWTDAIRNKREDTVIAWHREMADFLRGEDVHDHLITTSDERVAGLFAAMDYRQHHDYPNDIIGAAATGGSAVGGDRKPNFAGEIDSGRPLPHSLRAVLFASLMAGESGAAQPWYWDQYERDNLYPVFASAVGFVRASGLGERDDLQRFEPRVEMKERIDLALRPGGDWVAVEQNEFVIDGSNPPAGFARFPAYFFGANSNMSKGPLIFRVHYPKSGRMTIHVRQVAAAGAHLRVRVDGEIKAEHEFPATAAQTRVSVAVPVDIPAGRHAIQIENTGKDWALINDFTFTDAATPLGAYGVTDGQWAALWVYHRARILSPDATGAGSAAASVKGKVAVSGLRPGRYRAVWWDTTVGRAIRIVSLNVRSADRPALLDTPPIGRDVAVYITQ